MRELLERPQSMPQSAAPRQQRRKSKKSSIMRSLEKALAAVPAPQLLDISKMENTMPLGITSLNLLYLLWKKYSSTYDRQSSQKTLRKFYDENLKQKYSDQLNNGKIIIITRDILQHAHNKGNDVAKMTTLELYLVTCHASDQEPKAKCVCLQCLPSPCITYFNVDPNAVKHASFLNLSDISQCDMDKLQNLKKKIAKTTVKVLVAQLVVRDALKLDFENDIKSDDLISNYLKKIKDLQPPSYNNSDDKYHIPNERILNKLQQYHKTEDVIENSDFVNSVIFDDLLEINKYKLELFVMKEGGQIKYKFLNN